MQEAAIATGTYQSLLEDGMRLVREGKTSLSEVLRVLATEERI
jgi:type II secretory ATPase GspE/PulE/Tfp pilus assembly ATPase PilB-like protein